MNNNAKHTAYTITAEQAGQSLEQYLKTELNYSGRSLQKLTRCHGLFVNGKAAYLKRRLQANDTVKIKLLTDRSYGVTAETGPIDILYEDQDIIILNKPPYQLVHPSGHTDSGTLSNYLAGYWQTTGFTATIRPLHRLDRETSGCVLFAKSAAIQTELENQLKNHRLQRRYLAVVTGQLPASNGTINLPIAKDPQNPNRRRISPANGEPAITHYRLLKSTPLHSLVELILETGRTHQIRVHFAHCRNPLLGDKMYGRPSPLINRQALHASRLSFQHPRTAEPINITAPLPADMAALNIIITDINSNI